MRTGVRLCAATKNEGVSAHFIKGRYDCEISRRTEIPRSTVREWRTTRPGAAAEQLERRRRSCAVCSGGVPDPPASPYAYLLGMYLGDGCISAGPRAYRLRITLDAGYPGIVAECAAAIQAIRPDKPVRIGRYAHKRCVEVSAYWQHWPCLIPQHGPGRKHLRTIELVAWQRAIIDEQRKQFVRGLIHSDGCRIVANDRGRPSPRYHFSNLSEDIKRLYCESLDALVVRWTRPCDRQIAVYRKDSVAILDTFIGPKF
jgi:hypothetical protein